ncbi:hypothetical protein [Fibrobacter sp.]|uniref:hypothetical protein n=1 Tax=Fibrobacter sp. TaxID=35828 RepID=UPI00388F654A
MKTKIASFLSVFALSLLTLATGAFADSETGFYEKDHVRGFISIGGDYRGMRKEFADYVNTVARSNGVHYIKAVKASSSGDVDTVQVAGWGDLNYKKFNDYYLGLHVNVGAQYKQFMTWMDFNFMPPQVSKRPDDSYTVEVEKGVTPVESLTFPLYDVEWFTYGADWMFGWKLFGENTFINLIPAVGFGLNLINMHYASHFDWVEVGNEEHIETTRDRFYSTLATTINAELELRIELGRLALGAYGGYRFVRYNDMRHEGFNQTYGKWRTNHTDNVGDTYFLGLRLTWYFYSQWEKKQADKI